MSYYEEVKKKIAAEPKIWAVTGVAGFIGSNLLEVLLSLDQTVVGLDNFSTGRQQNLEHVRSIVSPQQWQRFRLISGDICEITNCEKVCQGAEYVLHQAALGSVPRSLLDPVSTNAANVTGFLNMLVAARNAKVSRFVYAASSSTYGDHPLLPKVETVIGNPLSPYAVTKYVNELYAAVFARCYGFRTIGLRYFNVFGPRQDPDGAYAAVIPKWISSIISESDVLINGDGETSRDFCYIDNAVQANIIAATIERNEALDQIYNIALGERTSLNELFSEIRSLLLSNRPNLRNVDAKYGPERAGDVRHSQADISKARALLNYEPSVKASEGLKRTVLWYLQNR